MGTPLSQVINLHNFEALAPRRLPRMAFDFITGGAEDERGLASIRQAS